MSGAGFEPRSEYPPWARKNAFSARGIQGGPMDVDDDVLGLGVGESG